MKIAFIGGGSVQWTPKLVTDMALTPALAGAEVVLHDVDAGALDLLHRAASTIVERLGQPIRLGASLDRAAALRGADFVILCVAIGGLAAMRQDLEIPERYGVRQSVGDTVGPGGLARGLRHIPFAVQVAREMEELCPDAWLLNLTNPMTTICRGISRATSIRAIGLCHEVSGVQHRLAGLFGVGAADVVMDVAGINHLPVLLRLRVRGRDGVALLRDWTAEHGAFAFASERSGDVRDPFRDRLALKLSLFEQLGVLFGAGDRHVAEFLGGILTEETGWGERYGVLLTTIPQRQEQARQRRAQIERFVAGENQEIAASDEQLAPVMAALVGGPPGQFVVNVPNLGQIDNLPRAAVVESYARIDSLGVRPLAVGPLPRPAYAAVAPHVARQELIVEAALTGQREPALAALSSDPLLRDVGTAAPMLDALLAANEGWLVRR
jgi:alpha-galactosidase